MLWNLLSVLWRLLALWANISQPQNAPNGKMLNENRSCRTDLEGGASILEGQRHSVNKSRSMGRPIYDALTIPCEDTHASKLTDPFQIVSPVVLVPNLIVGAFAAE